MEKLVNPIFPSFTLDSFLDFLQCYIFLCKVADDVGNEVNKVFEEWGSKRGRSKYEQKSWNASSNSPWQDETWPSKPQLTAHHSSQGGTNNSTQDTMEEPLEIGNWEENEAWLNEGQVGPRQLVYEGDQLVPENLQALQVDVQLRVDFKPCLLKDIST